MSQPDDYCAPFVQAAINEYEAGTIDVDELERRVEFVLSGRPHRPTEQDRRAARMVLREKERDGA